MLPVATSQHPAPSSDRPSWKTEAILRGNLRITGPSPADLPPVEVLEQDRDEPLPPKRFTDSHALDLRESNSSTRRRLLHKASLDIGHRVGVCSVLPSHKRTSTEIQETIREAIMPSSVSMGAVSDAPTPSSLTGRPSKRQKRGSLSAAFKKIFSSKRRLERERSRTASPPRHAYHHSEPSARRPSPPRTFTTEPRTLTSNSDELPSFSENIGRGTPNQLPFPMNVNAPQEESIPHGYIAFDRTPPIHRRRATLPSVVFNSTDVSTLSAIWSESASKHEDQRSIKDEIGIAVSGPEHRQSFSSQGPGRRSNRRSRSAGALEDLRKMHERDPSIRNSIMSNLEQSRTAGSRPQTSHVPTTEEEEDVMMQDEVFKTPGEGVSRASSTDTVMRASPPAKGSMEEDEICAFDFGPLRTGHSTPAFNDSPILRQQFEASVEPPFVPLDERMERLESNMRYFDESLRRLHGRQNRQTIILENAPPGRGYSRNLSTSSEDSPRYPKRPSIPFTDTQQQVPSPVSLSSSPHDSHFAQPQTSASVQSGQLSQSFPQRFPSPKTSLPNLMSSSSMTTMSSAPTMVATAGLPPTSSHSYTEQHSYAPDQMSALYSLLYHERAARQDLESQIGDLRREMGELRLRVERQYPPSHPEGYTNSTGSNGIAQGNAYANNHPSNLEKTHVTSNAYKYAAYPGTQNPYPTPSPDVSILLGTTRTSSTEQLSAMHPRISQLNYEDEAGKQRKSHFSFESDELDLPDSACASKHHSGSATNTPPPGSANSPGPHCQSFLRYGGPVVADRSSSVYEYGYPPDDDTEDISDAKAGIEEYQTPLEEPDSPPPRDGEEVFKGVGIAVGGSPHPMRKLSLRKMI